MAVERRNPLPQGLYWVDVFGDKRAAFRSWLRKHAEHTDVVRTQSFEPIDQWPARDWYLFRVLSPVLWEGPGLPEIAESEEIRSEDTQTVPEVYDPLESVTEAVTDVGKTTSIILPALLWGGGAYLLWRVVRK